MSLATHFKLLGAPLHNTRWSWGAARTDGSVVLRINAAEYAAGEALVWCPTWRAGNGNTERKAQLATGKRFYCVLCQIDPIEGDNERIKSFDQHTVFVGTTLRVDDQGNMWLKLAQRVPSGELS